MSLMSYLLSGMGPESEHFIDCNVENFHFLNTDVKHTTFIKFDELYEFIPKNKIMTYEKSTKEGKQICDFIENELPKIEIDFIKTSATQIIIEWKFERYIRWHNKGKNIIRLTSNYNININNISNIDVINFLYKSFNENIKDHIIEHMNTQFYRQNYEYLIGIDYVVYDEVLYIYPHFISIFSY